MGCACAKQKDQEHIQRPSCGRLRRVCLAIDGEYTEKWAKVIKFSGAKVY